VNIAVRASDWGRRVSYSTRYLVNAYPAVYMPLVRVRHREAGWAVRRDTELVIEAFGRSGSTFAVDAFELAQRRPVRLAHHTHAAAQVITAVRWGIPTLLIVRHPLEITTSHMARRRIAARPALAAWVRYHRRILPYRERLVITSFETLTADFGVAIRAVNERFDMDLDLFEHTAENESRVFQRIEARNRARFGTGSRAGAVSLARPTPEREAAKRAHHAELDAPDLAGLRARALHLYHAFVRDPGGG